MKIMAAFLIAIFAYSGSASAVERCDAIASSLIRAAMITPENAYDFSPVKMQIIKEVAIKWSAAPDMTPQTVLYRRP
ncbi:hypothetical protein FD815_30050, partial [Klebsiella pneumoniae]|nr:hypothetical protein [Klebsiella pneumoniae]MBQ5043116.1 hypothetical protein [Klebsiella pneumoniae]